MTENRLTDNEIIKALKCHANEDLATCEDCPLLNIQGCAYKLSEKALDLITRQKAENEELISKLDELESEYTFYKISAQEQIEALIAGQETLQKALAEKNAYIEDLKIENEHLAVFLVETKSEAVKEFAERFLKKIHENHYLLSDKHNSTDNGMFTIGIEQAVNETKIEMVGDSE